MGRGCEPELVFKTLMKRKLAHDPSSSRATCPFRGIQRPAARVFG